MRTNSIGFFAEESSLHNTKKKGSSQEEEIICGFDWATQTHYFVLKDAAKKLLAQGPVPHTAEGFDAFIQLLNAHRGRSRVALIVEANRGLPVNALIDVKWLDIYPVNPMKTRKLNELEGSLRQKSDQRDCHLLCDYLMGNLEELTRGYIERNSSFRQLQECISMETDLIVHCRQLKQRMISHLNVFLPDIKEWLPNFDKKVYVRYLEPVPDGQVVVREEVEE